MTPDQQQVLAILARHARQDGAALAASVSLAELDIDSLKFIMMILDIEQALMRPVFDIDTIGQVNTVGDLLAMVTPARTT